MVDKSSKYFKELNGAISLAKMAGSIMTHYYDLDYVTDEKEGLDTPQSSIFTEVDGKIDTLVHDYFRSVWVDDGLLTEETIPDQDWFDHDRIWMVDPIDGTWGYTNKTDAFGISIALIEKGRPVLGVLHAPELNLHAYAVKGEGAFHNGLLKSIAKVDDLHTLLASKASYERNSYKKFMEPLTDDYEFNFKLTTSVIVKAMYILENEGQIYVAQPKSEGFNSVPKFWDVAAADIILSEAGGVLTDLNGDLFQYNTPELDCNNGVLMGTPLGHRIALKKLKLNK